MRVSLLNEIDAMLQDLPEPLRLKISGRKSIRARINAVDQLLRTTNAAGDIVLGLRLDLLSQRIDMLRAVVAQDKKAGREITKLVQETGTSLCGLVGIAPRAAAQLIVTIGDIDRFTEGGFARYNGTAPIPASSGEGRDAPTRQRLSRGGNRQLNAAIHRINSVSNHEHELSTTTPANGATPNGRLCGFSSGTSPTSSTAPCDEMRTPP